VILFLIGTATAGPPLALEYEAALEQALQRNFTLAGADFEVDAADGVLLAAKGVFDPNLSGGTSMNHNTSESTREFGEVLSDFKSVAWNAGVTQVLPTGTTLSLDWSSTQSRFRYELRNTGIVIEQQEPLFQTRMEATITQSLLEGHRLASNLEGVRQAQRALDITTADRRVTRQQTLADTATAYWNLRYTHRLAEIAKHALETAQEEQRVVHLKVEQGSLAPVERSRVDAAVVQAESALIEADNTALASTDALLLLIGEPPGREVQLTTEPAEPLPIVLDIDQVVQAAEQHSPALQAATVRADAAAMALRHAAHSRLPQLDATARYGVLGYEPSSSRATQEAFNGDLPDWSIGANVSMPMLNRADRGSYLQRQAEAGRAKMDRSGLARVIAHDVRVQVRTLTAAHTQVRLARANLKLAEETLAADRALQDAGRAIQKDVLEAMAAYNDAQVALEKAMADYQLALIELERLKGTL